MQGVLGKILSRGALGPAAGAAQIGNGQERSDKARAPVIRIRDVVKGIESDLSMEPPGNKIGLDLPQIGVDLKASLQFLQDGHPTWQFEVVEVEGGMRRFRGALLNSFPVRGVRQDVNFVKPGELGDQVPTEHSFAAAQPDVTGGTASESTGQ
jgi:hypothetical protein